MIYWTLEIEALDDLHTGTGLGLGEIDALLARDRQGHPYLPASHIKGVLRALAEEWRSVCPNDIPDTDFFALFGSPGGTRGELLLTSAFLLSDSPSCIIWGATEIDESGTAKEDHLRFTEYLPAGTRFRAEAQISADRLGGLFEKIVARCDRLGAGRTRGHGRVQWHISNNQSAELQQPAHPVTMPGRYRLLLENLDGICLPQTAQPGNIIPSDSFLRGRTLCGALVGKALQLEKHDVADMLLSDDIEIGDALPIPEEIDSGTGFTAWQVLPIPLSIRTPKAHPERADVPWWSQRSSRTYLGDAGERDGLLGQTSAAGKPKRPGEHEYLFRTGPGSPWRRYAPQMPIRMHTQVPDQEKSTQALFSQQEISEHTLFVADLVVHTLDAAKTLTNFMSELPTHWLRIGRGGRPLIIRNSVWLPAQGPPASSDANFRLTLTSDLIARDEILAFETALSARLLAKLVGLPNADVDGTDISDTCAIRGFNAITGLPRPAQLAIRRGSTISITGPDATTVRERLQSITALGELHEEGFGRFVLDLDLHLDSAAKHRTPAGPKTYLSKEERLCREARELAETALGMNKLPSRSQWADFRSEVLAACNQTELSNVFENIRQSADKLGGRPWKELTNHELFTKLKTKTCHEEQFLQGQQFLDYFVRWIRIRQSPRERA